jgi:hypothetical protein
MDQLSYESFAKAEADASASQRGGGRDSLLLGAQMRFGSREPVQVRVRNLSSGGLMAEYGGRVEIGDPIAIEVRGIGWVDGKVAWAAEARVGVAFDQPVDPKRARKPVGVAPPPPSTLGYLKR